MSTQPPSDTDKEGVPLTRLLEVISPGLETELERILAEYKERLVAEADVRLKKALIDREAELRTASEADQERVRAETTDEVRREVTRELEARFEQKLSAELRALKDRLDEAARQAEAEWGQERSGLGAEAARWRALADFYRRTGTVISQSEILSRFLKAGGHYASEIVVYLNKADGLRRWGDSDGGSVFPELVSEATRDPEWYWTPVKVRSRVVLGVAAIGVGDSEALDALVAALQRAIENLGLRLGARAAELTSGEAEQQTPRSVG